MKNQNLVDLGVQELSIDQEREFSGGYWWIARAVVGVGSAAAYIYDHWDCIKAGIQQELQK
jgi:hypothetical protein